MFAAPEESILAEVDIQFNRLKEYVFGPAQKQALHEVEGGIFRQLLALGLLLLKVFLQKRGNGKRGESVKGRDGRELRYHGVKSRTYFSIFGKLRIGRAYYWNDGGEEGTCPLDAELKLPRRRYSYLLQDWAQRLGVEGSFDRAVAVLTRMLGIVLRKCPIETLARETAEDAEGYYAQKRAPSPSSEGEVMIVTADGKGVPMKRAPGTPRKKRLAKGDKRKNKKMATVAAVYTIDRQERSVEDIIRELGKPSNGATANVQPRPERTVQPKNKCVQATLDGEAAGVQDACAEVKRRDPEGRRPLVGLTDGDTSLQYQMKKVFRGMGLLLILDLFHAMEYLWLAAHVFCKEGSDEATQWVTERLRMLLTGKLGALLKELSARQTDRHLSATKRKTLKRVLGYYTRNRRYMQYQRYLAEGLPIGSGVVEGACRHLVNDRMELAGMRWVVPGAQAVLDLRAAEINGDWDQLMKFRVQQEHDRLYGRRRNVG